VSPQPSKWQKFSVYVNLQAGMGIREEIRHPPAWILKWSSANALVLLPAAFACLRVNAAWPVLAVGSFSLLFFLSAARQKIAGAALWNWPNAVSLSRWAAIIALFWAVPRDQGSLIFAGGVLLMFLDGMDGWLARRLETCTEFGEYFDKEIDSLFLLVVCLSLTIRDEVGAWILIVGLGRYLFVVAVFFFKPVQPKERRSARARLIYSGALLVLLALFLPLALPRFWAALSCAAALLFSFVRDIRDLFFGEKNG
jgi:phosphatidylglycerophosphate synthase